MVAHLLVKRGHMRCMRGVLELVTVNRLFEGSREVKCALLAQGPADVDPVVEVCAHV